jgi:hypothetical protein
MSAWAGMRGFGESISFEALGSGVEGENREFAMQPFEPSDGCLALRKLMANGSNGFDTCPYFWSH